MLELSLSGVSIPVPVDFSMELQISSPFCIFDKIPYSFSVDFSIPANEITRKLFGHPDRYTKRRAGKDQTFPGFAVRMDGAAFLSGSLKITGFSGGNYNCSAIDNVGELGEAQENKSILDVQRFQTEVPWVNAADYSPDDSPYACPTVNNLNFFKDKGVFIHRKDPFSDPSDGGNINDLEYDIELLRYLHRLTGYNQVNAKNPDGTIRATASTVDATNLIQKNNSYSTGIVNAVSPFFFLKWVISEALKENLFFFGDENYLEENADIKNAVIYNNFDLTYMEFEKTTEYHDEWVFNNPEYPLEGGQHLEAIGYIFNKYFRSYPATFKPVNHLPKMTIGELLVSTQNLFNLCFDFLPTRRVNIFQRDEVLKGPAIDISNYFIGTWEIGEKKTVSLNFKREHDENDLIFSEKYTDLGNRMDDIKPAVNLWEDLELIANPEEGEIRFVKSGQIFAEYKWYTPEEVNDQTYTFTTKDVMGWQQISIGFQNGWWQYGRDETETIESKWSTCWGYGAVCSVLQQGNMNAWKAKQQAFAPRLLLYRGNNSGGPETDTLSLDYEKPTIGLIPKLWKFTAEWWSDRLPVTGQFDFPVNMLKYVIYNKCAKFSTRDGEFVIENLRCTLFVDHVSETTINGYKV